MTLEQFTSLSDDELNRLAAEKVMRWDYREEVCQDYPYQGETLRNWIDQSGKCQSAAADWSPALDRVQSGWLLKAMAKRGAQIDVRFGEPDGSVDVWSADRKEPLVVPGNDARAETLAALLVAFAMEGKDNA